MGVDFGRRDVMIANEIYGYNKGVVDGKFKHTRKRIKIDRTTEDIPARVPPKIADHNKYIYLDLDEVI